jgi:hypothetical protein
MINLESLKRKLIIFSTQWKDDIVDLLTSTWRDWSDIPAVEEYIVKENEEMRPDIICFNKYGTLEILDSFLKFNNIGSWWSIKQGDLLLIPTKQYLLRCYTQPLVIDPSKKLENSTNNNLSSVLKDFLDPSKRSKSDMARLEYLKKKSKLNVIKPATFVNDISDNIIKTDTKIVLK